MQSQHAVINPDDDWMKVIAENTVTEDARAECISRLSTYLYTSYRFETGKGIFSASGLKRVSEDILRGATHVIAWVLMSLENPDSPLIIHEKKEFFQVVKIISNLLITMGLPADNIVFVKDPNMEKDNFHSDDDPDYLLPHQLFNVKRKFLDGKTKAIGKPHSKSRIIIPLNYHFNGWIEDRYRTVIANYLKIFECEQKEDTSPRLEGVAALKNISLFFGMYTGYDSNAELPADIMSDTLEGEQKALAIVPGQLLKVERASQFAKTEYYQQAECLINNILINKFDLLKDYFAKDIAEYFTL
jgi:gluconate kinase